MALDDTYDYETKVTEAALLTEVELAALLLPRDQPLGDEEGVHLAARAKAQNFVRSHNCHN